MSDWNPCPLCKASGAKQARHCATNPACTWHHRPVGCDTAWSEGQSCSVYDTALRSMAAVYAEHPDYRQEWQA